MSRLKVNLLFPATSSSYVYMIIVLNGVSGDMLATIELEDARGATVADLLEAVPGATVPRGIFSLVFGEVILQSFGGGALLSDVGIIDGMTLTFVLHVGKHQMNAKKAEKRLKNARQMIDKDSATMTWVVMDDVIDQVKAGGVTDEREAERCAQQLWKDVCFLPDIYRTDQEVEATQAEFICEWLHRGYSWEVCITHVKSLHFNTGAKRELSPRVKEAAMKRLMINAAVPYVPQDDDEAEDGG